MPKNFETFPIDTVVSCQHQEHCSGCRYLGTPYGAQLDQKKRHLLGLFQESTISLESQVKIISCGSSQLRDRLDFSLEDGKWGLYHKDRREIVDINTCTQISPELQEWLTEFRNIRWPFKKGSVRLRVGPQGRKGVWLDFANIDIKTLLDEKTILTDLQSKSFVEIGQRRKVPVWNGHEFKLKDPELNVWFQTWIEETPVDLYCQVASFTQPSLKANRMIATVLNSWINSHPRARIIEFGSGIGNLTLPALASAEHVLACEIDQLSLEGLKRSLASLPESLKGLQNKITIHQGDFQKKLQQDFSAIDVVLANPPRSGLMNFLDPIEKLEPRQRPPVFIYMSCFPESLAKDLVRLAGYGYKVEETFIVDQFPQTDHYEVMTLLVRK